MKHQQLAHLRLIKLILEDALNNLRIPIAWSIFADWHEEGAIRVIEYDRSTTPSEGKKRKRG